jgi:hypothetical protein
VVSVKKEYETRTHTVTEEVLVKETMYCDVCGKEIEAKNPYWNLTTHHHDWGNDSIDSYEYFDICSADCLRKKFDEYLKNSGTGNNTMCFDVERQ